LLSATVLPVADACSLLSSNLQPKKVNFGNFDKDQMFVPRTAEQHRADAQRWLDARSPTAQKKVATETGTKYSELLRLPYWDSPAMTTVDVMHNIYLGVVKRVLDVWKDREVANCLVGVILCMMIMSSFRSGWSDVPSDDSEGSFRLRFHDTVLFGVYASHAMLADCL
jgi:hypothetical protein